MAKSTRTPAAKTDDKMTLAQFAEQMTGEKPEAEESPATLSKRNIERAVELHLMLVKAREKAICEALKRFSTTDLSVLADIGGCIDTLDTFLAEEKALALCK